MFSIKKRLAAAVAGAAGLLVLGLIIALWAVDASLATRTAELKASRQETQTEIAKHAVTRGSLRTCQGIIDLKNAESEKRAADYRDSKASDAKSIAAADARLLGLVLRINMDGEEPTLPRVR